jgi:hypothetical protein
MQEKLIKKTYRISPAQRIKIRANAKFMKISESAVVRYAIDTYNPDVIPKQNSVLLDKVSILIKEAIYQITKINDKLENANIDIGNYKE